MNNIQDYLKQLKAAMAECDPATVQDALADAEEYLTNALEAERTKDDYHNEGQALQTAVEQYGTPLEVAAAYLEGDQRLMINETQGQKMQNQHRSLFARFFGIFADLRAWGALLYILISLATSIAFFTWSVAGVSLTISFIIFIFGLFFMLFFLYSIRGIALLEGRIVEALLGIRMPRRPLFKPRGLGWKEQLKLLLKDKHTWFTLIYTLLQMPLSIVYFTLMLVLIIVSLATFAVPVLQYGFNIPVVFNGVSGYYFPAWSIPLIMLAGVLLLTGALHLAKGIGILQGKWAKTMLVVD